MKKFAFLVGLLLLLNVFVACPLTSVSAFDASTGRIAYWRFDEGGGTYTADSSSNGNTGVLHGPTWTANGKSSTALIFDTNKHQYVSYSSLPLGTGTQMSVAAWVNSTFTHDGEMVYQGTTGEFALFTRLIKGAQMVSFAVKLNYDMPEGTWYVVNTTAPTPNVWHQIVGTWVQGENITIYVDGEHAASAPVPDYSLYCPGEAYPPSVGSYRNLYDFFDGIIDEVMIFNYALTTSEVAALYTSPFYMSETSLGTIGIIAVPFLALAGFTVYQLKKSRR